MAIAYKDAPGKQYVYSLMDENLCIRDVIDHIEATICLSDEQTIWTELVDCRDVKNISGLSGTAIRNAAAMEKRRVWADGSKSAILVSTKLHYGLARIFTAVASEAHKDFNVFLSIDDAI